MQLAEATRTSSVLHIEKNETRLSIRKSVNSVISGIMSAFIFLGLLHYIFQNEQVYFSVI